MPTHKLIKDPVRYKTILCANWTRCGACPYDYKCQFAHGPHELRARKDVQAVATPEPERCLPTTPIGDQADTLAKQSTAAASAGERSHDLKTSTCSPCSSAESSPRPEAPLAAPRQLMSPLPGLKTGAAQTSRTSKVAFTPIPFSELSIKANNPVAVPQFIQDACKTESSGECSPLRCNRKTGKVEHASSTPAVPGIVRKISSFGDMVRRQISFVLDDELSRQRSELSGRNSLTEGSLSERSLSGIRAV